jgi:hypothetical protein
MLADAERELAALRPIAANETLEKITIWAVNPTSRLVRIAVEVLAGEIAAARRQWISPACALTRQVAGSPTTKKFLASPWSALV